jgi:two-component system, OmpR family, sensor kinase
MGTRDDHRHVQTLRRLPIRLRLTLAFAAVMAVVLTATGTFVYLRMGSDLKTTVDTGLRSRGADVAALARNVGGGLTASARSPLTEQGENLAQVLSSRGAVLDATPRYRRKPLITLSELRRASAGPIFVERPHVAGLDAPLRVLATPVGDPARRVAVVGALLDDRDEALHRLLVLLAIGGPIALALASGAAYGVASAALRPVEAMHREAAAISPSQPGRRLPVPPADDEISRLGASLNEMLERQEAAFERERSFVADASHELRTPLSILRAELELSLREGRSHAELVAAVRSAADETERLSLLAQDLLVLARADRGRIELRTESLPARELLEAARDRFAARAAAAGRSISIDNGAPGGADEPQVRADRVRIDQALTNLVDNALRHGAGEVVLAVRDHADTVSLHVRDGGGGFPPDFLPHAFERFTRAEYARPRGGTGLGLAIVAAIAEAHGGAVQAANRPGGGADVQIDLPA